MKILVLKAQCFSKQRHFQEALEVIDEVVAYTKKQTGKVEYAFALVDRANILAEMNAPEKFQKAIEDQELAISTQSPMKISSSRRTTRSPRKWHSFTPLSALTSRR